MRRLLLLFSCLSLVSCAWPINRKNAERYHDMGTEAALAKDYVTAEKMYERALLNAELGKASDRAMSLVTYNLGLTKGYLCKYQEAETLLLRSLQFEEKAGNDIGVISMRVFELARLYYDHGQYEKSLGFYSRGVALAKKLDVQTSDPIAFAGVLEEYADALQKMGRSTESVSVLSEAKMLRAANPGKKANFVAQRYNQQCSQR